jgi:putative nucleotidyltransferase with HDIG domain
MGQVRGTGDRAVITLNDVIRDIDLLDPLPAAAAKLAKIARDWEADINEAVTVIRYDQGLTANILRYANSPMGGARFRIAQVRDAVVRLGIPKVLEIAVTAHVRSQMMMALPEYGYAKEELWKHSVAVAADVLASLATTRIPPVVFTAALLHDVGKLILARHLDSPHLKSIAHLISNRGLTYSQAEQEILGFTHATVGARITEVWNLGDEIARAVGAHHDLDESGGPAADAVRICNLVAKSIGCGLGNEGMNLSGDTGASTRLGLASEDFESLCAEVQTFLPEIEALYA